MQTGGDSFMQKMIGSVEGSAIEIGHIQACFKSRS
jgi:hypothetical protein